MGSLYAEESILQIVLITGLIGGGAAWLSGQAIAGTWRPIGHVFGYMLMLGAGVRFVHFALFEATLLSLPSYLCDTAYLVLIGLAAWKITRTNQIVTQYPWLYERTGLWSWREREEPTGSVRNTTSP